MPNIFSLANDRLVDTLARREQAALRQRAQEREMRLDDERRTESAENRKLRDRQITSMDEDRDARLQEAKRVNDETVQAKQRATEEAQARAAALDEYTAAIQAGDDARARVAGARLLNLGGKTLPDRAPYEVSPGATLVDPITKKPFYTAPKPAGESTEAKDNPRLPMGAKKWIEAIAARGVPIEEARRQLSADWAKNMVVHPRAELGEGARYLDSLYPSNGGLREPMAPAPVPAAPSGRASGAGPGGGAPRPQMQDGGIPPEVAQALANEPDGSEADMPSAPGRLWRKVNGQIVEVK